MNILDFLVSFCRSLRLQTEEAAELKTAVLAHQSILGLVVEINSRSSALHRSEELSESGIRLTERNDQLSAELKKLLGSAQYLSLLSALRLSRQKKKMEFCIAEKLQAVLNPEKCLLPPRLIHYLL